MGASDDRRWIRPPTRARLTERGHAMLAGAGAPYENGYLETTVWADLDLDAPGS